MFLLRYVLINGEHLGWAGFMQVVIVEVWFGVRCICILSPYVVFRGLVVVYRMVWYLPVGSTIFL